MSRDVVTLAPDETVRTAAKRLHDSRIGSLVIVDDGPVGIVTQSDLTRLLAEGRDPDATPVSALMTQEPVTIGPEATLEAAARLLSEGGFRRLPVVEADELVGIVTSTDLSYFIPELAQRYREANHDPEGTADMLYSDRDWEFHSAGTEDLGVGDEVRFRKTLSEGDVRAFAAASGDTNRLHLDAEFATKTRFERRIVHGTLAGGTVSAALARLPGLTIYLGQDLTYLGPVDIGERVTAVCEVVEDLGKARYRLATSVYGEDGECVIEGEATVLVDALPEGETESVERWS